MRMNCFLHFRVLVLDPPQRSDTPMRCGFVCFIRCFLGLNSQTWEVINGREYSLYLLKLVKVIIFCFSVALLLKLLLVMSHGSCKH